MDERLPIREELEVPAGSGPVTPGRYQQQVRARLRAVARENGVPILTFRILNRLVALSGKQAGDFLYGLATELETPVLIIGPAEGGPAPEANVQTVALAPRGWSEAQVMAYVGELRADVGEDLPPLHAGVMALLPGQVLPEVKG